MTTSINTTATSMTRDERGCWHVRGFIAVGYQAKNPPPEALEQD